MKKFLNIILEISKFKFIILYVVPEWENDNFDGEEFNYMFKNTFRKKGWSNKIIKQCTISDIFHS